MSTLSLEIHNIKNIKEAKLDLPFDNGVYTFVGANGCGKSTLMLCMSQLLSKYQLNKLSNSDFDKTSYIKFAIDSKECIWNYKNNNWTDTHELKFNGLYEGSLFYGTRFEDSTRVETMIKNKKITTDIIADADNQIKEQLSYILHGSVDFYKTLKRVKNKYAAEKIQVKNRPYFIQVGNHLISQYRMSSGECMLVSLLHFLYNSIERRSLPVNKKVLVLIDELELALHPIAIARLMEYLNKLAKEHSNLVVYLSSHSSEVIRATRPSDIFYIHNNDGIINIDTNCYPSYLIRDLYSNVSPDYLLLVEDELAQLVVDKVLSKFNMRQSKLIHCVPVGGYNNVLELHKEFYTKKVLGTNTNIISIIDGDMEDKLSKEQQRLPHLFLPIPSIEKFLYDVIKENKNSNLKKVINDKYFIVKTLDEIIADYTKGTLEGEKDNNKNFYKKIRENLKDIGTDEKVFISGLCDDLMGNIKMDKFVESLKKMLNQ